MTTETIPADEWVELVPRTLEDDYSIVVDGSEPVYIATGDEPSGPVAGIPITDGAVESGEVDRGDAIYARSQTSNASSARVVPGIRIDGSNERAVSLQVDETTAVVEVNADQTATVSGNSTLTSTVRADDGEVWRLEAFRFEYNAEGEPFNVTLETENQGVEVGYAEEQQSTTATYYYRSGGWGVDGDSWNFFRDDIVGTLIDDTNGLNVEFFNNTSGDISNTRTIRFQFEVIRVE